MSAVRKKTVVITFFRPFERETIMASCCCTFVVLVIHNFSCFFLRHDWDDARTNSGPTMCPHASNKPPLQHNGLSGPHLHRIMGHCNGFQCFFVFSPPPLFGSKPFFPMNRLNLHFFAKKIPKHFRCRIQRLPPSCSQRRKKIAKDSKCL